MARDLLTAPRRALRGADPRWRRFAALVALLLGALALWLYLDPTPGADGSAPATIVVRQGEGWTEVAERLRERGIVRRPLTFKAIVLLSGVRAGLMPGRYEIARGTSSRDIIAALTDPGTAGDLVIPPGWRLEQVGEALASRRLSDRGEWEDALNSPPDSTVLETRPPGASLEGYIYPGTYRFTQRDAARELVGEAVSRLEADVTPEITAGLEARGLSLHEGLTLASIIERETRLPEERPVVASVYLNRLRRGMRLQADPTTQYAVGEPGDWWKAGLTREDLRSTSPYNTYAHEGLPPGPICSPGLPALRAAAQPAETEYLYFVARGDGGHAFAETYEEHLRNVRRYLGR